MSIRFKIIALLVTGALLALLAAVASFSYLRAIEAELASARTSLRAFGETVAIPVARKEIPQGQPVTPEDVQMLQMPANNLPADVLRVLPDPGPDGALIALAPLAEGAMILPGSIAVAGSQNDFDVLLSQDQRAVAIQPGNIADLSAELAVGRTVDLFWSRDLGGGSTETRLLASAMSILRLPIPSANPEEAGASNLLVAGSAEDMARILEARQAGTLNITLAHGQRTRENGEIVVSAEELTGLDLAIRRPAGGEGVQDGPVTSIVSRISGSGGKTCTTAVIRAGMRTQIEVPCQ